MRLPKFSQPLRNMPCLLAFLIFCSFMLYSLIHVFVSARVMHNQTECSDNMRQLAVALAVYTQDWDETLPPANHWAEAADLHIPSEDKSKVFHCPEAHSPFSYVFNANVDRLKLMNAEHTATTPLLYEQEVQDFNAVGDGVSLPAVNRHVRANFAFLDGHIKGYAPMDSSLNWKNENIQSTKNTKP